MSLPRICLIERKNVKTLFPEAGYFTADLKKPKVES